MGVVVKRFMNGIGLNGFEYLLGNDGEPQIFETEEKAKECLRKYGWTDEAMSRLVFERTECERVRDLRGVKQIKKLERYMDAREFLRMIMKKYPSLSPCVNCPHPNGECVEFAKQGKCRAYG